MNAATETNLLPQSKLRILQRLSEGKWVIDDILPVFRSKLVEASFSAAATSRSTTTKLAAFHYRKLFLDESHQSAFPKIVCAGDSQYESFWRCSESVFNSKVAVAESDAARVETLNHALQILSETDSDVFRNIHFCIGYFCLLRTSLFRSASHPHFFGTIFLSTVADPNSLAISIVHELAHQELFLINLCDRLVNSDSDYRLAHAPFQGKPRPPIGRMHSAHALFRMCKIEEKLGSSMLSKHKALLSETVQSFSPLETSALAEKILNEVY